MTTTYSNSALDPQSSLGFSSLKTILLEPLLVAGVGAFWVVALPFVAFSLLGVKIWDTLAALKAGKAFRPNPLILRRGSAAQDAPAFSERRPAKAA